MVRFFLKPAAAFALVSRPRSKLQMRHDSGASLPGSTYDILYDDGEDLIIVNKSSGLLTVPGIGEAKRDCLIVRLREDLNMKWEVRAAHRLDRDTSGLLAVPRSQRALRGLSIAFQDRQVTKRYRGRVRGKLTSFQGDIEAPIGKTTGDDRRRWSVLSSGRPSLTRYRVLSTTQKSTDLELTPVTGRSQQLRVHLAHIGAPLLGDLIHADDDAAKAATRLCLHASRLEFDHPCRPGDRLVFESQPTFDDDVIPEYLA